MKNIVFFIFYPFIFFYISADSQEMQHPSSDLNKYFSGDFDILKNGNKRNGKFVVDSTYLYLGNTFGQDWFDYQRYKVTERDDWGNYLNAIRYEYDTIINEWFAHKKYSSTYFDSVTSSLWDAQIWDSKAIKWRMSDSIAYNTSGNPEISWYKVWDPFIFRFRRGQRVTYSYQSKSLVNRDVQKFDTLNGNWKNDKKYTYSYNTNDLIDNELIMDWDSATSDWENYEQNQYFYNENLFVSSEIVKLWNQVKQWENNVKIDYEYFDDNNLLKQKSYSYWISNVIWDLSTRTLYSYDEQSRLIESLSQVWDDFENKWYNTTVIYYSYNSQGLRSEVLYRFWDPYGYWTDLSKYLYTYDEDGNQIEYLFMAWDYENNLWVDYYKNITYWSEFIPIGINEISVLEVQVFPNPGSDFINISFKGNVNTGIVNVYSMNGELLLNRTIHGNSDQLDIGALPIGNHVIVVDVDGKIYSQIVIKK